MKIGYDYVISGLYKLSKKVLQMSMYVDMFN